MTGGTRREPHDRPTFRQQALRGLDQRRAHRRQGDREQRYVVALPTAKQLVDRYAERLAGDVVERDVDGGHSRGQDAATLEILAAVETLPEGASTHRVGADQEIPEMRDGPHHGFFPPRQARFAPSVRSEERRV